MKDNNFLIGFLLLRVVLQIFFSMINGFYVVLAFFEAIGLIGIMARKHWGYWWIAILELLFLILSFYSIFNGIYESYLSVVFAVGLNVLVLGLVWPHLKDK